MPPQPDDAVCIRHWDWSETSQMVSMFGRELGLVRAVAKGSRRDNAPFSGGVELLTRGEMMVIPKQTGLSIMTEWDLREPYAALRGTLRAYYAGMYLADLVQHVITDADPHPRLFAALTFALEGLTANHDALVLRVQWAALEETGYKPDLSLVARTGDQTDDGQPYAFSPSDGAVVIEGESAANAWRVRTDTLRVLCAICDGHETDHHKQGSIARASRLLAAYWREIIGREPPAMRSYFGVIDPVSGRQVGPRADRQSS